MRAISLFLIGLGHLVALLACAWMAAQSWGPMEGGPSWRVQVPLGITATWLLAVAMLVAAWKLVRGRGSLRSHAVGLASSALGLGIWVPILDAQCHACRRFEDVDMPAISQALWLAPSGLMVLYCAVLLAVFLHRWLRRSGPEQTPSAAGAPGLAAGAKLASGDGTASSLPSASWSVSTTAMIGAAIGQGAIYVTGIVQSLWVSWALMAKGMSQAQAYQWMIQTPGYLAVGQALALGGGVFGGYWTAKLQPASPMKPAALAGGLLMVLSIASALHPLAAPIDGWWTLLGILTCIPGYLLGAWLARRRMGRAV